VTDPPIAWVVGRGLLGRAVEHAAQPDHEVWSGPRFAWNEPARLHNQLSDAAAAFTAATGTRPWRLLWCAGAGVVATPPEALAAETEALRVLLHAVTPLATNAPGAVLLASSAGGVYAGADGSPFTEHSPTRPLVAYGQSKLDQEALACEWAAAAGASLVVARIANLYGKGQDLTKPQGLISQLVHGTVRRQPVGIYVSLDTLRDYLFADDCGVLAMAALHRVVADAGRSGRPETVVKILASERPVSVATILAELRRVVGRPPRIVVGASPLGRAQVRDLRFRSSVWPDLVHRPLTTLSAGIDAVFRDVLAQQQRGFARTA
jgi:UDP-glucose 4-epimerase